MRGECGASLEMRVGRTERERDPELERRVREPRSCLSPSILFPPTLLLSLTLGYGCIVPRIQVNRLKDAKYAA